jgi:hypothetical protein
MLNLIEAAERVDQRHKPETIERAREVQAILARGGIRAIPGVRLGRRPGARCAAVDATYPGALSLSSEPAFPVIRPDFPNYPGLVVGW